MDKSPCYECPEYHDLMRECENVIVSNPHTNLLEAIRDAAAAVNNESGPDLAPSLSSMAKLAAALHAEWLWRIGAA